MQNKSRKDLEVFWVSHNFSTTTEEVPSGTITNKDFLAHTALALPGNRNYTDAITEMDVETPVEPQKSSMEANQVGKDPFRSQPQA